MPTETVIAIVGVIATFVVFAVVLAWGDFHTNRNPKDHPGPAE